MGRVADIDLYVHATFLILIGYFGLSYYQLRHDFRDVKNGLVFIGAFFFIVLLHELGHALAARRYGIETRDITLLPIGGVARLERMPEQPVQEIVVALAGPAVNAVLALLFLGILHWQQALAELTSARMVGAPFVANLAKMNLVMLLFNLLPAFPMDGGRVLRAALALRLNYVRATQIAATIGQGLALLLGFVGLFQHPLWVFIALFVWMGASDEASMVQMKSSLDGIPIQQVMVTDFKTLQPQDSLAAAVKHILSGFQQEFPVVEESGGIVGMLKRADLLAALAKSGDAAPVSEVMQRRFETAEPSEMAAPVFARLQQSEFRSLPVVQNSRIIGLVTPENVGEFLMVQSALRGERPAKMAVELAS